MGKDQHHRKLGDLAGLQGAKAGQHDPAFAAVVFRHEKYHRQKYQRQAHQRPGQFVPDMVIHQRSQIHGHHPQCCKQQLGADVGEGISPAIERHRIPGREKHHQTQPHQQQQNGQKRQVQPRQAAHPPAQRRQSGPDGALLGTVDGFVHPAFPPFLQSLSIVCGKGRV